MSRAESIWWMAARSAWVVGEEGPDGRGLDRLTVVDAVGGEGEVAEAAFGEMELHGSHAGGVAKVGEVALPVEALGVEQADEGEEVGVAGVVVEPEGGEGVVLPAELAPVLQGARGEGGELIGEVAS